MERRSQVSALLSARESVMKGTAREQEAKRRLLQRLLISYNDFKQAAWIASYILDQKLQDKVDRLRGKRRYRTKLLWEALNCAMVVSYCRPFSGNERRSATRVPDLPGRFLRALDAEEKAVHAVAMEDRNTMLAHSDSAAWDLQPFFLENPSGRKLLVPLHNDTRAPLVLDAVSRLRTICVKLMELIMVERKQLEKELADVLPTMTAAQFEDANRTQEEGG